MKVPDAIYEDAELGFIRFFLSKRKRTAFSVKYDEKGFSVLGNRLLSHSEFQATVNSNRAVFQRLKHKHESKYINEPKLAVGSVINSFPHNFILCQAREDYTFGYRFNAELSSHEVYVPRTMDFQNSKHLDVLRRLITDYLKRDAKKYLPYRVDVLAQKFGFQYTKVGVTTAIRRWGSCSSKKHLNFSAFVLLLGAELIDSVIIHELCHTIEMNHSQRFWDLFHRCFPKSKSEVKDAIRKIPIPKFLKQK